jgi:hypothetical protein
MVCAGAAAGIGIIAIKELKNMRSELMVLKKEKSTGVNDELNQRLMMLEKQISSLSDLIKKPKEAVIKNAVETPAEKVNIINNEEYEEIEVTDDEAE